VVAALAALALAAAGCATAAATNQGPATPVHGLADADMSGRALSLGPKTLVGEAGCSRAVVVPASAGAVSGYAHCGGGRLLHVQRAGTSWKQTPSGQKGDVLAVAADGANLLAIVADGRGMRLLRRAPQGRTTSTELSKSGFVLDAAIGVRGGRWLAVWSEQAGYGQPAALYEAGTLIGTGRRPIAATVPGSAEQPTMTLRADGTPLLAYVAAPAADAAGSVVVARRDATGWRTQTLLPVQRPSSAEPQLASDAAGVALSYSDGGQPTVAEPDGEVTWQRQRFATQYGAGSTRVAVSDGALYVAWSENNGQSEGDGVVGILARRAPGARSFSRTVVTPDVRPIIQDELADLVVARDRATVLMVDEAARLYARTER
jgi:hypothetical protein